VRLLRQDFPFTAAFREVATQTTTSAGSYGFTVGPLYSGAKFQVQTQTNPAVNTPVATVGSRLLTRLRVSSRTSKSARLRGLVYPLVKDGTVSIQRKTAKGRWIRVKRASLTDVTASNRSSYKVTVPRLTRSTRYRALIKPNDAGAHETTTTKSILVTRRK
jgi:hypothetical protein